MWVTATILLVGLFAVILATEGYGLRFGGVVVIPLLGVYVLFDWLAAPLFVISTGAAFLSLLVIERRLMLYGRRLLITAIVSGALVPVTTVVFAEVAFGGSFPLDDIAYLGSVLPGIAAYNLHRLDREERIADIVGSLALIIALVLLTAVLHLAQSTLSGPITYETVLSTAESLVLGRMRPEITPPARVLPRPFAVGMFVVGLLLNEGIRKRYGLRLAGIIAIPLVALFTLQDGRLLGLYLTVTLVAAGFIRVIHRTSLLYGRTLLGGACVVGVVVASFATPFLPAAVGIRPLIIGILGGISAYNGHALAPGERIQSIVLSAAAFVVLFAIADGLAMLIGGQFTAAVHGPVIVLGCTVLGTAAFVLLEFERRRPDESIETIVAEPETPVPDGGASADDVVADGGKSDPLGDRRVTQIGSNAERVVRLPNRRSRDRGGER